MIKLKPCEPSEVQELIKLATGSPTSAKIRQTLATYEQPGHHLLGYYNDDKLIGFIGLYANGTEGIIKHIAVWESHQKQRIGQTILMKAINYFHLQTCEAETDEEGKGFYEKCGFECVPFQGKYNPRFRCSWIP